MANETITTTSNYSQAHVDRWLREELLTIGERDAVLEMFTKKAVMPEGMGATASWLRYNRLDLPTGTLTEGTAPGNTQLGLSRVNVTLSQYGLVVAISDRLEIQTNHDVLEVAAGQVRETIAQLRDKLLWETVEGAANFFYSGTSVTARSGLADADVLDSEDILRAIDQLEAGDNVRGRAARFKTGPAAGMYAGFIHPKVALDLRQDTVFNNSMIQQDRKMLESTNIQRIFDWEGVRFFVTNYMPEYENMGNAISAADDEHDATVTGSDTGGTLLAEMAVQITRKHKTRLFEEGVYNVMGGTEVATLSRAGADNSVTVVCPTNTNYVYNIYVGDHATVEASAEADVTLEVENAAAASSNVITAQSGTTTPPTQPAAGLTGKVYPTVILGPDALGSVDLSGGALEAGVAKRGRSHSDPLAQLTKVGAKMYFGSLILDDNALAVIESTSDFTA